MLNIYVAKDSDELAAKIAYRLEELILEKLNQKDIITVGLSGGSLIDILEPMLPRLQLPWARLRLFFVDERFVPFSSNESVYGNYQTKLFRKLPIIEKNIIKIDPATTSIEQCAKDYENKLREIIDVTDNENDSFDIVLLGMGSDGHTASLFPNHSAFNVTQGLVTYVKHSPKPPFERITLTLNAINQAKYKLVVITGESKSIVIKDIMRNKHYTYPICQIKNLYWYLDKDAAKFL